MFTPCHHNRVRITCNDTYINNIFNGTFFDWQFINDAGGGINGLLTVCSVGFTVVRFSVKPS